MSVNIRDYVSDNHIESIGEIAKSQSAIIQALSLDNSKLEREIERLKQDNEYLNKVNIELSSRNSKAMKYINEKENNDDNWIDYELLIEPIVLIDILRGSDK